MTPAFLSANDLGFLTQRKDGKGRVQKFGPAKHRTDAMRFALIPNCVTRAGDGLLTVRFTESMNEIRPRSARQYSSTEKITGFNSDLIKWC